MQDTSTSTPPAEVNVATSARRPFRFSTIFVALGAGLLASILAVVLMGILRLFVGIPTPVELFGDNLLKHLDADTFVGLLIKFSPNSKTAPLGLALLAMIGLGTLLGLLYMLLVRLHQPVDGYQPGKREWLLALAFSLGMTLIAVVWFWDELPQNTYGLTMDAARNVAILGQLAVFALYGLTLCLAYRAFSPRRVLSGEIDKARARRQLLARAGGATLGLGGVAASYGLVRGFLDRYASYDGIKSTIHNNVTPPITPNDEHYVVTQNAIDPTPDIDLWRLEVSGLVATPGIYTYAEVQQLPSTSRPITLECIANGRGDHLISTAIWQGVTLKTLLDRHGGAQPGATHVAFYSVDGYNLSLPLNEVLAVDPVIAWRMNGTEIPLRHGFPLRVLIPGRYGEENIKWLTRLELIDHFEGGLYADQGWYNGPLHTMSRIDRPRDRVALGQSVEVGGIAFAGARGIQTVEISIDGGANWNTARLQPALSQDSWVLWTWLWTPLTPGTYTIASRATDGTGAVQTSKETGTVPNGTTGYHKIIVQVV